MLAGVYTVARKGLVTAESELLKAPSRLFRTAIRCSTPNNTVYHVSTISESSDALTPHKNQSVKNFEKRSYHTSAITQKRLKPLNRDQRAAIAAKKTAYEKELKETKGDFHIYPAPRVQAEIDAKKAKAEAEANEAAGITPTEASQEQEVSDLSRPAEYKDLWKNFDEASDEVYLPVSRQWMAKSLAAMREKFPATFRLIRFQYLNLTPTERWKILSSEITDQKLRDDPEVGPLVEYLDRIFGTGSNRSRLEYLSRSFLATEKYKAARSWEILDKTSAELASRIEHLEALKTVTDNLARAKSGAVPIEKEFDPYSRDEEDPEFDLPYSEYAADNVDVSGEDIEKMKLEEEVTNTMVTSVMEDPEILKAIYAFMDPSLEGANEILSTSFGSDDIPTNDWHNLIKRLQGDITDRVGTHLPSPHATSLGDVKPNFDLAGALSHYNIPSASIEAALSLPSQNPLDRVSWEKTIKDMEATLLEADRKFSQEESSKKQSTTATTESSTSEIPRPNQVAYHLASRRLAVATASEQVGEAAAAAAKSEGQQIISVSEALSSSDAKKRISHLKTVSQKYGNDVMMKEFLTPVIEQLEDQYLDRMPTPRTLETSEDLMKHLEDYSPSAMKERFGQDSPAAFLEPPSYPSVREDGKSVYDGQLPYVGETIDLIDESYELASQSHAFQATALPQYATTIHREIEQSPGYVELEGFKIKKLPLQDEQFLENDEPDQDDLIRAELLKESKKSSTTSAVSTEFEADSPDKLISLTPIEDLSRAEEIKSLSQILSEMTGTQNQNVPQFVADRIPTMEMLARGEMPPRLIEILEDLKAPEKLTRERALDILESAMNHAINPEVVEASNILSEDRKSIVDLATEILNDKQIIHALGPQGMAFFSEVQKLAHLHTYRTGSDPVDPESLVKGTLEGMRYVKDSILDYNQALQESEVDINDALQHAEMQTRAQLASPTPSTQQWREFLTPIIGSEVQLPRMDDISPEDYLSDAVNSVSQELRRMSLRSAQERNSASSLQNLINQLQPHITPTLVETEEPRSFYDHTEIHVAGDLELGDAQIYLPETAPIEQIYSSESVGKYMTISESEMKRFFPEGFPYRLSQREFHSVKSKTLLVRQQTIDAVENLKLQLKNAFVTPAAPSSSSSRQNANKPESGSKSLSESSISSLAISPNQPIKPASLDAPRHMLIHGYKGCGKSAILSQTVYWARKTGWLVIYISDAGKFLTEGSVIVKNPVTGLWDQPKKMREFFTHLIDAHFDKLKQIPLKTPTNVGKLKANTLFDVVEYGSVLDQYAGLCWTIFERELRMVTEFPVLIAVDSYNATYIESPVWKNPESTSYHKDPLTSSELTLGKFIMDLHLSPNLSYGTSLVAVSDEFTLRPFINYQAPAFSGNLQIEPLCLDVPPYSMSEFRKVMKHYRNRDWVRLTMSTGSATEDYIYQVTSGFGHDIWNYCKKL